MTAPLKGNMDILVSFPSVYSGSLKLINEHNLGKEDNGMQKISLKLEIIDKQKW